MDWLLTAISQMEGEIPQDALQPPVDALEGAEWVSFSEIIPCVERLVFASVSLGKAIMSDRSFRTTFSRAHPMVAQDEAAIRELLGQETNCVDLVQADDDAPILAKSDADARLPINVRLQFQGLQLRISRRAAMFLNLKRRLSSIGCCSRTDAPLRGTLLLRVS
ncbi:MAG: hypothetical protein AAF636_27840 [Pseudomonadota bacterium]